MQFRRFIPRSTSGHTFVAYCTRDGCSFKLAAYRVPPVTVCKGQPLHVHAQLADSTVVFRATV